MSEATQPRTPTDTFLHRTPLPASARRTTAALPADLPADTQRDSERALADFSMSARTLVLLLPAAAAGALATLVAVVLLALIGLITNLLYRGTFDPRLLPPDPTRLGLLSIAIPVVGGLVIGLMARYGSERIRGHGIPEAMETILVGGSRVEPRLTVLKPTSSAISIGSGGPFGAEGPIILTGGALGSLLSQTLHLSSAERKTLLVAGAAAGMTAVFATPVASVVLAAELLLFEWKPRSLVPVATAVAVAAALRIPLADAGWVAPGPLFPVAGGGAIPEAAFIGAALLGVLAGGLGWLLTVAVYGAEDLFKRVPIHWMWWPAIGGLVIGIGGLIEPRALGVGYDSIRDELSGSLAIHALVVLAVVKLVIWALALGSGTSGGILAPLLLIGGAVGASLVGVLPLAPQGFWALIGMSATLAAVTRSPITSIVFALELSHDQDAMPYLLAAGFAAYAVSVLVLKRSILTEKIARRGFHVTREYAIDPLEALLVHDVMATHVLTVRPESSLRALARTLDSATEHRHQRLFPVVDTDGDIVGVVGRRELMASAGRGRAAGSLPPRPTAAAAMRDPVTCYPDETLRRVADRMVLHRVGVLPVVDRGAPAHVVGMISQFDLLRSRERLLVEERHRERTIRLRRLPLLRVGAIRNWAR
jgi:H+/Cl- antiporter ClcA/predicted transcriptional regulator